MRSRISLRSLIIVDSTIRKYWTRNIPTTREVGNMEFATFPRREASFLTDVKRFLHEHVRIVLRFEETNPSMPPLFGVGPFPRPMERMFDFMDSFYANLLAERLYFSRTVFKRQ